MVWPMSESVTAMCAHVRLHLMASQRRRTRLFQFRVLSLRSDENRNVRVGVFPEREEILIGRLGLGGVALHGVGSTDLEMRECSDGQVQHNLTMVEDFLELGCGLAALM